MKFENPQDKRIITIRCPRLFPFLIGPFYFLVKGIWIHAIVWSVLIVAIFTLSSVFSYSWVLIFSWILYPFFSPDIVKRYYLKKGWILIGEEKVSNQNDLVGLISILLVFIFIMYGFLSFVEAWK